MDANGGRDRIISKLANKGEGKRDLNVSCRSAMIRDREGREMRERLKRCSPSVLLLH